MCLETAQNNRFSRSKRSQTDNNNYHVLPGILRLFCRTAANNKSRQPEAHNPRRQTNGI